MFNAYVNFVSYHFFILNWLLKEHCFVMNHLNILRCINCFKFISFFKKTFVQTVPFHALRMTFYWTNAHSARIPPMEIGVTRNAPTSVNHVIYETAHVMIVNKTTRDKIVQVYSLSFQNYIVNVFLANMYVPYFFNL